MALRAKILLVLLAAVCLPAFAHVSGAGTVASTNRMTATWATYDAGGNLTVFKNPNGTSPGQWSATYDGENKQRYWCGGTAAACTAANDTAIR